MTEVATSVDHVRGDITKMWQWTIAYSGSTMTGWEATEEMAHAALRQAVKDYYTPAESQ